MSSWLAFKLLNEKELNRSSDLDNKFLYYESSWNLLHWILLCEMIRIYNYSKWVLRY